MNTYIVTWFDEEYEEYRTEQVDANSIIEACYYVECPVKNVISVVRLYKGDN